MDATRPDKPTKLRIEYVEVPIEQLIRYFVSGYNFPDRAITSHEYYLDTAKGKAVLKLFTEAPLPNDTSRDTV